MSFNSSNNTVNLNTNNGTNGGIINISDNNIASTNVFNGGNQGNASVYFPFSTGYSNSLNAKNNFYYYLPFSSQLKLLIQWGTVPDQAASVQVYFNKTYSYHPFVFLTNFGFLGAGGAGNTLTDVTNSYFTADPQYGTSNKGEYQFLAIGFVSL
jgi:hypothetical protein